MEYSKGVIEQLEKELCLSEALVRPVPGSEVCTLGAVAASELMSIQDQTESCIPLVTRRGEDG